MKKRFIAGATCPQCGLQDKIFIYHVDGEDLRECNACGYRDERPKNNEPESPPADGVVKIMPATKKDQ